MIDINALREDPEKYKKGTRDKGLDPKIIDKALELDAKRRALIKETEDLRAKRNEIAKKGESSDEGKKVKESLKKLEPELKEVEEKYKQLIYDIPNLPSQDTPVGKDESENIKIREWGKPREYNFKPKDHLELGQHLGIIDVETAAKVSGSRFGYFKGDAVLLEFALVNFALEVLTNKDKLKDIAKKIDKDLSTKPFIPVVPPVFIKENVFEKMARLHPKEERYFIPTDDLYLVGSAEHTLGPMHMDETIPEKELPIRYVGYSTSFRREAGTYGKDTRGVLRVHQFNKLEMESFTTSENSIKEQDFFVAIQEQLMQSLSIPYQVIAICTGDMGKPDHRQIDINSWMPGQGEYRETHTADLMTDYQSRRLNTKVMRKGETEYVHMNDATAFAIGRTIIAILENYQEEDGSVKVPEVLQKYMGKDKIAVPER